MSTKEDNTAPEVTTEETVFKFGNSDLTDVIFDVDGKEFHCHKMLLAAKCDYFASMFASGFKEKDQERITIDADPAAFKRLMEIIYNGYFEDAEEIIACDSFDKITMSHKEFNRRLWKTANDLFALADRFLLTDVVRKSFETSLFRFDHRCVFNGNNPHCGLKLLLALCYKMDGYKKMNNTSRAMTKKALLRLSGDIHMPVEAMAFLLEHF